MNREEFAKLLTRKREDNKCRKAPVVLTSEDIESDIKRFLDGGGKITQVPINVFAENINQIALHGTSDKETIRVRGKRAGMMRGSNRGVKYKQEAK